MHVDAGVFLLAPWMAAALLGGVAAGVSFDLDPRLWLIAIAVGWLVALVAFLATRPRVLVAAVLIGCVGAGGALGDRDAGLALDPLILRHTQPDVADGCEPCPDGPVVLEGRLRDDADQTEFGAALTLEATAIERAGRFVPTTGGVRLSVGGAFTGAARDRWRGGRLVRVTATLRRPQPYDNFGVPSQEARTALRGIRLFGSVKSAALVEVVAHGSRWREAGAEVRARVRRSVDAAAGPANREAAAIVIAVLIGDRAGLSPEMEARLQRAGTFHVIAISGGNIAILVGVMLWLLRRAGCSPRAQAALALAGLAAYAAVVSAGSSVARATLAASLYLVARTLDHRAVAAAIVAATAGALLLARPLFVLDAGFWLTFVASMAILAHAETIATSVARQCRLDPATLSPTMRAPFLLLAGTVAAEGSLAPIAAFVFSQVTAAGLLLNFVAVPLMTIVQLAGLAAVAASAVHPVLAKTPGLVAVLAARGITDSAYAVDFAPWSAPHVPPPPLWLTMAGVASWWGVWQPRRRRVRQTAAALWIGVMTVIVAGWAMPSADLERWLPPRVRPCAPPARGDDPAERLRVVFLDVGQGSSTLVELPDGAAFLIDAGGSAAGRFDVGARVVSPALWALGRRRLSTLVLTHGDLDHVGGAAAIVDDFRPREIWEGVPAPSSSLLRDLSARAAVRRVRWRGVMRGLAHVHGGVALRVVHPERPDWERPRVRNDDSIVIELRWRDVSVVLPGDIGADVERAIATDFEAARLRVLVAAHHGSRQSTSEAFLEALGPSAVVISAGRDNRHGHPSPQVLARLERRSIRVLRTDRHGAIALDTDGHELRFKTCRDTHRQ